MALAPNCSHFFSTRTKTILACILISFLGVISHAAELTLTWTDNSDNETGFKIQRRIASTTFSEVTTVGANVETYTDTGLTDGTQYWYQVCATNSAGDSGYTDPASATTAGSPIPNTAPTLGNVSNQTVLEEGTLGPIAVVIGDAETSSSELTLSAASSNASLIPLSGIEFGGSNANRTVTITPASEQSGSATITVTVSDGELTASDSFVVTVSSVNDRPTISNIANRSIPEDGTTGIIAFTVGDIDTSVTSLTLSGSSSNTGLIPLSGIVFSGSGENRTVTVTPNAGQSGTSTITVTVSDGGLSASDSFVLTVTPAPETSFDYDLPSGGSVTLSAQDIGVVGIAGSSSYESDNGTFTIVAGGVDLWDTADGFHYLWHQASGDFAVITRVDSLTNPQSFAKAGIMIRESLAADSVHATANLNPTGSANFLYRTISGGTTGADSASVTAPSWLKLERLGSLVTASYSSDGSNWTQIGQQAISFSDNVYVGLAATAHTTSDTISVVFSGYDFAASVAPPTNTPPSISNITNRSFNEDSTSGAIAFTVSDAETSASALTVSGSSSNTALIPLSGITFSGSGENRVVTVASANNQTGTATITVTVSDGDLTASDSFTVTVNPVNDRPTIGNITNRTISESSNTGSIGFSVSDLETADGDLILTGGSSNTSLVPVSGIVFGGSGSNRTVTVTPASGQSGTTTITVTVSDGQLTASDSFTLTVSGVNDAPTISNITNKTVNEDRATAAIGFTISDAETAAGSLTLSGSSSNTSLVPNSNIVFGGSAGSRTVTVSPAANQSGSATITITVSDGSLSASDSFMLTVTAVNDAPTISNISNRTIGEGANTGAIGFTVTDIEDTDASLTVAGASSNASLVPQSGIVFGGSGSSRTVTVTPTGGQSGTATITVTVSDGSLTDTDTFTLTVTAGPDPVTATIISPTSGESFELGTAIQGEALTTDISRTATVEFFHGSTQINTERLSPYNFNWTPTAAGSYSLKAVVTDTDGAKTESPTVSISVTEPLSVSLTSPTEGTTFADGATISVTGTVNDETATDRVELLVDGSKVGEDANAPYAFVWSGATAGAHAIRLRAIDNEGQAVLSNTVSITVEDPLLTVSLLQPLDGLAVDEGATVMLEASTSDDTRTASVEFFVDGSSVGSATGKPYRVSWQASSPGNHEVKAEANDNSGKKSQSRSAAITVKENAVPTEVRLVSPLSSDILVVGDTAVLEASVEANQDNVGRIEFFVNGVKVGQSNGSPYIVDWVALEPGDYTIIARAVVPGGDNTDSEPVTVTAEPSSEPSTVASGVYRGKFKKVKATADQIEGMTVLETQPDETGSFAIFVDEYGLMTFLGYDEESGTGFVEVGLKVTSEGFFDIPGRAVGIKGADITPQAPPSFVRGRITDKGITGQFDGTDLLLEGGRVAGTGPAVEVAGSYELLGVRSNDTRVRVIVSPDGVAFALSLSSDGIMGEEVAVAIVDQSAYLESPALNLEIVIDPVEGGAQGIMTGASGEVSSLMGLRSDVSPIRRLENISTRGSIASGDSVMITGFVVSGSEPKTVLIRAVGPGLSQFGVNGVVQDPVLDLVGDSGVITSNAKWILGNFGGIVESVSTRLGAFDLDPDSLDAALLVTVAPGRYSAVVRDTARQGGAVLIEVYDATDSYSAGNDLFNLSTRGSTGNGNHLIGGFVVTGNVPKRVLIRGIGPGLAEFGIGDSLPSTHLIITQRVDGGDVQIAENQGWASSADLEAIEAATESAGAFLLDPTHEDSALLIWLEPGVYTAQVEPGQTGQSGTALIEVYQSE